MEMLDVIIETKHLYCSHLSDADMDEIKDFEVINDEGAGVERFIKLSSYMHEDANLDRSYLVRVKATDELVAYFSLQNCIFSTHNSNNSAN
jgi:hypothetical protein